MFLSRHVHYRDENFIKKIIIDTDDLRMAKEAFRNEILAAIIEITGAKCLLEIRGHGFNLDRIVGNERSY